MSSIIRRREIIKNSRLPSGFQEVEYIQSSGTQYIDTAFFGGTNISFNISFNCYDNVGQWNVIFAGDSNGSISSRGARIIVTNNGYSYYHVMFYGNDNNEGYNYLTGSSILGADITATFSGNTFICNEEIVTTSATASVGFSNSSVYIFTSHTEQSLYAKMKLYYFKMYNNGTLVRDFVPCYCTTTVTGYKGSTAVSCASGTIGLYDLVNDRFYINSGSGTFTKGSDV